jgi:type I restriction-modification system DNA methylase subunit
MDNQLPQEVSELIERFERNQESYISVKYNEAQLREEFINPFFEALGWDVRNTQGNAEAYKDVIHEDAIKIGSAIKAPDYCFRIGGTRKFFVEAKKPSIKIDDNSDAAFQLRRYAWSAKLPLGILTNFKEFAVYDCRVKPEKDDKASTARISYFTYKDYPERWSDLEGIFSKQAILQGSFDRYAESSKLKKGTATVDDAFLEEIESWRSELAHKIAIRNTNLTTRELNFAVQRTIDRIIFLRICEDRGMEQYGKLQSLMNGVNVYKRLFELFQHADQRYNSGLFHFSKERDREEEPDDLTPFLNIDDEPIKDIINRLYYPESPYEFSVLSADILGQVYEQFLGKVIRLTEGHHAKIEEKPEVRKAGGIYYTPTYIVDYIVKNTVGRLLEFSRHSPVVIPVPLSAGSTPAGIQSPVPFPPSTGGTEGRVKSDNTEKTKKKTIMPKDVAKLRILDPACGSGSFLIGAYQYLLDWHLDWYVKDGAEKYAKAARPILYQAQGGSYRLTTYERKRILLNNIYGVDIDPQAVEVTKLSLLLKVLEGENSQTLDVQFKLFHERALPDLANNIKCGNSLIGPDFYQQQSLNLFNDDERLLINAFDWNTEFSEIMNSGGFDAVIGNPPYVLIQDEFRDDRQLDYFRLRFVTASYKVDTYHLFIERVIELTKRGGLCSLITPANYLTNNYLSRLRGFMLKSSNIDHILVIDGGVFSGISVDTAIFVVGSGKPTDKDFNIMHAKPKHQKLLMVSEMKVSINKALSDKHILFTGTTEKSVVKLWDHIFGKSDLLGKIAYVNFGKQLRDRKKYPYDVISVDSLNKVRDRYRPCYTGRDIKRYYLTWGNLACLNDETAKRGGCWDAIKQDGINKLLARQIGKYPEFAIDTSGYQCLNTMFMINLKSEQPSAMYVLGILNSHLIRALWIDRFYDQRSTFPKIKGTYLMQLPIRSINFSDPAEKARHDKMVSLVDQMLSLNKQLTTAKTDHEKTALQRQIDTTDKQIDELVYELYGITDDEKKIIEGGNINL